MRNYRITVGLAIWAIGFIAGYGILIHRVMYVHIWFVLWIIYLVSCFSNYFVSVGASAAEGMQVSFMVENQFTGGYSAMRHCDEEIRR